jgi:hypothetical protein
VQQQQQAVTTVVKSARISGDSQASSFSLGGSDIGIDYEELASLGINLTGPSARQQQQPGGSGMHTQHSQQKQLQQQQGPLARPTSSFGLPPRPQQQQQQQQQLGSGLRQPGVFKAAGPGGVGVGAAGQQPVSRPAQPAASDVFYGYVSGAPMRNAGSYY